MIDDEAANIKITPELWESLKPKLMSKYRTAVIVGRFQTPYLHAGHKHLINTAYTYPGIENVFIIIGCQIGVDDRNPYTFQQRRDMIKEIYPKVITGYIMDEPDNNFLWSAKLDAMLEDFNAPLLFGSRDSFHQHYKGHYDFHHVDEIPGISATKIRNSMSTPLTNPIQSILEVSRTVPERDIMAVLAQATEEMGELAREVAIFAGSKDREPGDDGVLGEGVDLLSCIIDLLYLHNPNITSSDIQKALEPKLSKWESRPLKKRAVLMSELLKRYDIVRDVNIGDFIH